MCIDTRIRGMVCVYTYIPPTFMSFSFVRLFSPTLAVKEFFDTSEVIECIECNIEINKHQLAS